MALKKLQEVVTNVGTTATFPDCYIKVSKISGDKVLLEASVSYYTEQSGVLIRENRYFIAPDLDGDNFISQIYEHLKTLPEFEGAEDC
jgi:hypothetical protein